MFESNNIKSKENYIDNKQEKLFLEFFNELNLNNKDIPIEGNVRQGMIGDTDVVLLEDNGDIIIESLRTNSKSRGKGSASNALDKIIESVDKRGILLKAKILPENSKNKGLGVNDLKIFYEKRGFIFNDKNEGVRTPKDFNNLTN